MWRIQPALRRLSLGALGMPAGTEIGGSRREPGDVPPAGRPEPPRTTDGQPTRAPVPTRAPRAEPRGRGGPWTVTLHRPVGGRAGRADERGERGRGARGWHSKRTIRQHPLTPGRLASRRPVGNPVVPHGGVDEAEAMIDTGLAHRTVLVTGGSGGIGRAISRAFAAEGSRVAVHYHAPRDSASADGEFAHVTPPATAAEELAAELGEGSIAVEADLAQPDAATRLFDEVESRLGGVDVLVNNAAHCETPDGVEALTAGGLERHYRVNAIAPALLTSELARRARGRPACVVNISTDAARAFPGQIGYGTSKGALEALTRGTALDLGESGVRVNAVAPGPVQTGWMDSELVEQVRGAIPLRRVGEPEDIADAVVFLASHQARWVTGQVLQVAGGHAL